jgi:hypothetical protein
MGFFRFRRSVRIGPGVRLNFSKSGVSTSVGLHGAHVTIGHGKVRETVGLPGTGLSYTEVHSTHADEAQQPEEQSPRGAGGLIMLVIVLAIVFAVAYVIGALIR